MSALMFAENARITLKLARLSAVDMTRRGDAVSKWTNPEFLREYHRQYAKRYREEMRGNYNESQRKSHQKRYKRKTFGLDENQRNKALRLKAAREARGMTQAELAERIKVKVYIISKYETGFTDYDEHIFDGILWENADENAV